MKRIVALPVTGVALALQACSGQAIAIDVLHRSSQCRASQPGLTMLADRRALERAVDGDTPFAPKIEAAASVDFTQQHVVLVAMGEQPTAGYRLRIETQTPRVKNQTLWLPIQFDSPTSDAQAQVMTRPCLVVGLSKGPYREIRVDRFGLSASP